MEKLLMTKKEFKAIMEVLPKASKKTERPILQGVHFYKDEVVTLDGYRMSVRKLNTTLETECIIDSVELKNVLDNCKKQVDYVEMTFLDNKAILKLSSKENGLISEYHCNYLCNGSFPNHKSLLPSKFECVTVVYDNKKILDLLKGMKKNSHIFLEVESDTLCVYSTSVVDRTTHLELLGMIDIKNKNKSSMKLMMNSTYLKDAVKDYKSFEFNFTHKNSSMTIEGARGYELILPIRVIGEIVKAS